jgi:hypothetical protein
MSRASDERLAVLATLAKSIAASLSVPVRLSHAVLISSPREVHVSVWNQDSSADDQSETDPLDELRDRLAHAVGDAIDVLADKSVGRTSKLVNDRQLRACIALARLAPVLLCIRPRAEQQPLWANTPECPRNMDPVEAERLLAELERGAAGDASDDDEA